MNKQCIEADMGAWRFWQSRRQPRTFADSEPQRRGWRAVTVQHVGLLAADLPVLQQIFDRIGRLLGVDFELRADDGDLLLLDLPTASRLPSERVFALAAGRPVLLVAAPQADGGTSAPARRDRMLLSQLRGLPLVRQCATTWMGERWLEDEGGAPATPADDSPAAPACAPQPGAAVGREPLALLRAVTAGRRDRSGAALQASYGPGAHMLVRFDTGTVALDRSAQRLLRVHRKLPQLCHAADDALLPAASAVSRSLDETVWDLGVASGTLPLLQQPVDWWRTPLQMRADAAIGLYSRAPRHLELARCLHEGPATPAVLSRRARVDTTDMRAFVQACLALELVAWAGGDAPPQ